MLPISSKGRGAVAQTEEAIQHDHHHPHESEAAAQGSESGRDDVPRLPTSGRLVRHPLRGPFTWICVFPADASDRHTRDPEGKRLRIGRETPHLAALFHDISAAFQMDAPPNALYKVETEEGAGSRAQRISSLSDVRAAPEALYFFTTAADEVPSPSPGPGPVEIVAAPPAAPVTSPSGLYEVHSLSGHLDFQPVGLKPSDSMPETEMQKKTGLQVQGRPESEAPRGIASEEGSGLTETLTSVTPEPTSGMTAAGRSRTGGIPPSAPPTKPLSAANAPPGSFITATATAHLGRQAQHPDEENESETEAAAATRALESEAGRGESQLAAAGGGSESVLEAPEPFAAATASLGRRMREAVPSPVVAFLGLDLEATIKVRPMYQ